MKISVCFKTNPDYDKIPENEWKNESLPDFTFSPQVIGYYDEGALETALCIKDELTKNGQPVELEAVTVGLANDIYMSHLYAVGYDNVVVINENENTNDYSLTKCAKVLAEYYSNNKPDIILSGKMAEPFESGALHYYLAKEMDISVISNITHFQFNLKGEMIICAQTPNKLEKYEYKRLFIGIVDNAKTPYLRMYTLESMNKTKDKEPGKISIAVDENLIKNDYTLDTPVSKEHSCKYVEFDANQLVNIIKEA